MQQVRSSSLTKDQTQTPWRWEEGALATGPPGKSLVFFFIIIILIFNWKIIALQGCVGFCHTMTSITRKYTISPPTGTSLPPTPTPPPGCQRVVGSASCVIQPTALS